MSASPAMKWVKDEQGRLVYVNAAWEKAFEVNVSENEAMRASCVEFVLAGLYATERISRATKHGKMMYET